MAEYGNKRLRLDILLVEKQIVESRSRARAEIMAGHVLVDGVQKDKPGLFVSPASEIRLKEKVHPYVSRGGLKLKKAIEEFGIDLQGKVVLDIGASTGGFTDCSLRHGAKLVYALDVGFGQLAWELRNHPRVVSMERFNVRNLRREHLDQGPDTALIDVSFISLRLILPVLSGFPVEEVVCLVKPQFEAKKAQVGKKGVVRRAEVHREVLFQIATFAQCCGYAALQMTYSPLRGPRGNIEYFLHLLHFGVQAHAPRDEKLQDRIKTLVEAAHTNFDLNSQQG